MAPATFTATLTTDALLLRSVDYRDADRIVSLFTWELGPVSALARGARKSRKRFGGSLEPCALLRVELGKARGDLRPLGSAEVRRHFEHLSGSLNSLSRAGAALRTLRVMLPAGEPAQDAFRETMALFEHFDAHGSASHHLTAFQLRLMGLAGLTPDLEACGRCERVAPPERAALLDPASGRLRCRGCGGAAVYLSAEARALVTRMTTSEFLSVAPSTTRAHDEVRRALTALAAHHLAIELPADPVDPPT